MGDFRMPSTMKSIVLIALIAMLTLIANTAEARPSPKESFESRCGYGTECDWGLHDRVCSHCATEKRCQLLIHLCASDCIYQTALSKS